MPLEHQFPLFGPASTLEKAPREYVRSLGALKGLSNRCQSLVSGVMNWAVSEDLLEISPTHGITKRGAETPRERVLSDAELKTFWDALRPTRIDDAIRLLLLLGQRREEA